MADELIFPLILGLFFSGIFFIVDIYNENKTKEINTSLIAGITITYFFLVLLPEINIGLEELHFGLYKFIGILLGFSTIHLTEKIILLRVEQKSQIKLKEIFKEEAEIIEKEKKAEKSLINKLVENDEDNSTVENLVEKLFALEEINKIQEIWIKEEQKLKEKIMKADLKKLTYLNILSRIKEISNVQKLCAEEEMTLENSIMNNLVDNPTFNRLTTKLRTMVEMRQKEIGFGEKAESLISHLITSLMADKRDKISKEEFIEKLNILDNIHQILMAGLTSEKKIGKIKIEDLPDHYSEKRASKNSYALEVLGKIQEACIEKERKIQNELMKIGQTKLSLLNKISALKEICKIRFKCVEEEDKLEKQIVEDYGDIFTEKTLANKLKSLKEISNIREQSLLKEKFLLETLIDQLIMDNKDNQISVIEFNEKLAELVELRKLQERNIKQEKDLENDIFFYISRDENERVTLQELAVNLDNFCQREEELAKEETSLKVKIQNRINEHLDDLHKYTNFGYHLLIGILLFQLLTHEFITAILFFVFALFKALTSKTSNDIQLFPGIEINEEYHEPLYLKILLASAALLGVLIGFLIDVILHVPVVIIFLLFSFISGVILYTIIREVLPENESGRPLYFVIGIVIFLVVIIITNQLTVLLSGH